MTKADLLKNLPAANGRYTPKRKAAIVAAVNGGAISQADACKRYDISTEEYGYWIKALEKSGKAGLRVTYLQAYQMAA